jgi:hypothetical protein
MLSGSGFSSRSLSFPSWHVVNIFLIFFALLFSPFGLEAQELPSPYLEELIQQAITEKLYQDRNWHLLLHYRKDFFGGYTSEVDDPGFFLSPNGKTHPEAELQATLTYFFSDTLVGRSKQPAQCAFVARYHWLKEKLHFQESKLSPQACERFDSWLEELNPASISFIFPSAYMDNPASMFGHSFLRIDQKGQTAETNILAYTINYAAEVPPDAGIEFAYKGILGGYKGFFSTIPYYMKVKEYRDIENRDIWEYRLNFSQEQNHRLLMHAWELGNAYFDYYFFKENCAYHILSLLEVADPNLHLTDQFHVATIPADTIRLLIRHKGLVKEVSYRPARSTLLKRKHGALEEQEISLLPRLVNNPHLAEQSEFLQLPQKHQTFLLDLASDVLRYKGATDQDKAEDYKAKNRSLLVARSQIKIPSPPFHVEPFSLSPEHGHETLRVGVGGGWRNDEIFEEISVRAAYHDLLDPDPGYTQDAQIVLADLRLRHYHLRNQFRVERFTFANVLSLAPIDSLFVSPSWKINVGMDTVKTSSCELCSNGHVNAGIGGALESQAFQREVFFLFGELDANVSGAYEENHRVGGGVSGGVMATITHNWKWLVSAGYMGYFLGDRSDDIPISVGQRWTLVKNFSFRTTFTHHNRDNEVLAVFHGYF